MQETKGVLFFNRGSGCIVRAMVALSSLRNHWKGAVTFVLEEPYPKEFEDVCKFYNVDVKHNPMSPETSALVRKTETLLSSPYDKTLWLDADVLIVGNIDEMFDLLDENISVVTPHFAGWISSGRTISKRIRNFKGKVSDEILEKSLVGSPAINTGILSYKKDSKFMRDWVKLALETDGLCFIADEISFQVLYPSYPEVKICDQKYNVSVKFGNEVPDKRCIHFHGKKHCLDFPLCQLWKAYFNKMMKTNEANINHFAEKYPDKRLVKYLVNMNSGITDEDPMKDVTVVTVCDTKYVEYLRLTYPTWVKYKKIDKYPMIVFVNGIDINDKTLDFLRNKNTKLIQWDMPSIENHREKMLSAFVFGTAKHVVTDYWLKLDADGYAVNDKPLITNEMKQFAFCGHKWKYSRPEHINQLDLWASSHWKRKLFKAKPMILDGKSEGNRFYHNKKRTISYIQLHKTRFTKFCVSLLKEERLPVPSQDTYMFYVCDRFDPHLIGTANFKRFHGFMQGNSRLDVDELRKKINLNKTEDVSEKRYLYPDSEDFEAMEEEENNIKKSISIKVDFEQIKNEDVELESNIIGYNDVIDSVLEKK